MNAEVPFTNNFAQHFGSAIFILHGNLSFQMMLLYLDPSYSITWNLYNMAHL